MVHQPQLLNSPCPPVLLSLSLVESGSLRLKKAQSTTREIKLVIQGPWKGLSLSSLCVCVYGGPGV
jgi:hypothetical protein